MIDRDLARLLEQLERQEDRRYTPYMDCCGKPWRECSGHPKGSLSAGVGLNLDAGLSDEEIDYLLASRVERAHSDCLRTFPWFRDLDSVRQAALVNLCFNLGLHRLLGFERMIAAMARGDYDAAAREVLDSEAARKAPGRYAELAGMVRSGEWRRAQESNL